MTITDARGAATGSTHDDLGGRKRVVLVDDHQLIRSGLRLAFQAAEDLEVVGDTGLVAEALVMIDHLRPDVVVTDIRLPDGDGVELTAALRADHPGMGIVVLTMYTGDDPLLDALEAGASGFVGKDAPAADVVAAARHAAHAPGAFAARDLAGALARRADAAKGPGLSPRELQVLELVVDGRTTQQIGRRLDISEATVKTHIGKVYGKLGVDNRAAVVMAAVRLGLVGGLTASEFRTRGIWDWRRRKTS